jgi:hypothetical protein
VPKVLLFTDKKGVPMLYKGLSVAFEKKLNFGIVRDSDSVLVGKYQIKSFPSVIVLKTGERKPFVYTSKEFNFKELFTFLNIYSEVFVPGGGSSLDSSATKQWMTEICTLLYMQSPNSITRAQRISALPLKALSVSSSLPRRNQPRRSRTNSRL